MLKANVPLQAVLLADSFTHYFRPISLEVPKVLFPVVNIKMIDLTLEWLASNKVEEVNIYLIFSFPTLFFIKSISYTTRFTYFVVGMQARFKSIY